jgi:hypothetical protein
MMILLSLMYPIWSLKSAELGNVSAVAACLHAWLLWVIYILHYISMYTNCGG